MKTLKITTDNKISIIDVDFKEFRSIQQAVGGYFETVKTRKMWDYFKAPVIMLVDEEGFDRRYGYVGSKSNTEIYIRSRN